MRFHRDSFNLPPPFDVGTNLFIGNLDPDVDEKIVYDTFSTFGGIDSNPMTGSWLQVVTGSLKPLPLPSRSPKATLTT
ncbi:hypothetical protein DY000_02060895 [Brassica cretica]|uniref:RRM domain-containing protein n=1 Tax=Brassica cretica TaxID=69181 RepID=A0ABQ7APM0_BRACR|nr:hypothetical protein DY000_02060895 [Brassica cretica]